MGELLGKFLSHYDTIHFGFTPSGIANGLMTTCGRSFPRVRGGYNLYRGVASAGGGGGLGGPGAGGGAEGGPWGEGFDAIDFVNPVGAAGRDATAVLNFAWRPHAASTRYAYALKSIGGGGVESEASWPARWAEFDGAGALLGPRPDGPSELQVRAAAGGAFEVRWRYVGRYAEALPAEFRLYNDGGSGAVNYGAVVAVVAYVAGRVQYEFVSAGFGHGARRAWGVRAVTAAGVDDGNVLTAFAWSDGVGPAAAEGVGLERVA